MYSEKVMDHFTNPRNVGEIADANGVGQVGNPKCGDIMKMYLKIEDNIIIDAKFKTFGCGAAVATSSMATELVKGKTVEEALNITNKAVAEALDGLPPVKMHCSNLAEEAIRSAIEDYKRKNGMLDEEDTCNACGRRCEDLHNLDAAVLRRYRELGGEIISLASDAHNPDYIGYKFNYFSEMLLDCSFTHIAHFEKRKPVFTSL